MILDHIRTRFLGGRLKYGVSVSIYGISTVGFSTRQTTADHDKTQRQERDQTTDRNTLVYTTLSTYFVNAQNGIHVCVMLGRNYVSSLSVKDD